MSAIYFSINPNMLPVHVVTQVMIRVNFLVLHIKEEDRRRRITCGPMILEYGNFNKTIFQQNRFFVEVVHDKSAKNLST